ncbi:MAG: aldose 1-epimerase family protein [Sarcina sp.]
MLYNLENEFLNITAHEHGGELHSIQSKLDETEFLWNGNPEYWKYHAPILFPIIGKVKDGQYKVNDETYDLPQHGLARTSKFTLGTQTQNSISFELKYSDDSLKVYPYKFLLTITYTLVDKSVKTTYTVKNLDNKKINFSVGAHPAYMCPISDDENLTDYYFEFNKKETTSLMMLNTSTGLFTHNTRELLNNENKITLSKELFKDDALVFDCSKLSSKTVSIKTDKHKKSISFDFSEFPYLGLWAPAQGAPFVCIEPWFGHADFEDFTGSFNEKAGILELDVNKEFSASYTVTIHE